MEIVFIQLLLEFYHILFIVNLKPNNFEQTNKSYFKKLKKTLYFAKINVDWLWLLIIDIKFYFVQASSYSYLVQKLGLRKFKHSWCIIYWKY